MPEPWLGDVLGSWALGSDGTMLPVLQDGKPWHGQAGSWESPARHSRAERGWMQHLHLMDEFCQVLQQSRKLHQPQGHLETKDSISPPCLPCQSSSEGSFVLNPTSIKH